MKLTYKAISYTIFLAIMMSIASPAKAQDSTRTVKVGCDYAYYPYEFINEDHEADGFDIDIIKEIGFELNIKLDIQAGNWFKIKNDIETEKIDIVAGMYYLPDRAEKVNFSMPYIIITHSIFVKKGDYWQSLKDVRDQKNLKVVVENSSILHKYLTTAGITPSRIIPVENQLDALKILSETPNSCALLPDLQGKFIARKNGFDNIITVGLPILPREYSIAVKKSDTLLLNQINDAITKINQNGNYQKIYSKWFGDYETPSFVFLDFSNFELILLFFIALLIGLLILSNARLRRKIKKRNKELNEAVYNKQKIYTKLTKSESILEKMKENTPYPIAILNSKRDFSYVNRLFEDEFGITKKEAHNFDNWVKLCFPNSEAQKAAKQEIDELIYKLESDYEIRSNSTEILSITNKQKDILKVIIQIVSLVDGQLLFFFENVTDVLKHEEKLKQARIKAESADRLKSSFLANISHEIRTPMNSILGFSSLLAEQDIEEEDKILYNSLVRKNGNILLLLIQDIIDFSKIEAGELNIEPRIIDLTETVNDTYITIKEDFSVKIPDPIQFNLKLPKATQHTKYLTRVDPVRLSQVLINLLTNSFKYTDKGIIEYGFYELENNKIRVYVKDTGIGIKKAEQEHIFKRFSRVDSKDSLLRGGTGLGLAIAYQILKLFGSELFVESELKKGSTFYFDLNFYEGQGEKVESNKYDTSTKTASDYHWDNKTILIIEDNKENANFLIAALKKTNCHLIVHSEGKDALEELNRNNSIDLIILDWVLPDIKGEEISKFIKKKYRKMPIVVITALALFDDKVNILGNRVDAYFAKPVKKTDLLIKMNELLILNDSF